MVRKQGSLKRCILPSADSRRRIVLGAWLSARLARYAPTVAGAAGTGTKPCAAHHWEKCAQSAFRRKICEGLAVFGGNQLDGFPIVFASAGVDHIPLGVNGGEHGIHDP